MFPAIIAPITLAIACLAERLEDDDELSTVDGPRYGTPIEAWCPTCRGESCDRYGMLTIEGDTYSDDFPEHPYRYWEEWDWIDEDEQEEIKETGSRILWTLAFANSAKEHRQRITSIFGDGWTWHDRIRWRPLMPINAKSWKLFDPFPEIEAVPVPKSGFGNYRGIVRRIISGDHPASDRYSSRSADGRWVFVKQILPLGQQLNCSYVNEEMDDYIEGTVYFTGDVVIPSVFERGMGSPWMSMTPQEIITQMPGLDHARTTRLRPHEDVNKPVAHVIVVGLGLGWLLCEVAKLPNVARVTLVEQDQELVDWLLPHLCPMLPGDKPIDVVVGDAYEVMKTMKADLALVDIWPALTDIGDDMNKLEEDCPGIDWWWGWGYR